MKINLIKKLGVLKPLDPIDVDYFYKLKEDTVYSCEIKKLRNPRFHRMFFAMINICFDNQEIFKDIEYFRKEMLKASGYYNSYVNHKGITQYEAKSISFGSMDQDEFKTVYESVFMTCIKIFNWEEVKEQFINELNDLKL